MFGGILYAKKNKHKQIKNMFNIIKRYIMAANTSYFNHIHSQRGVKSQVLTGYLTSRDINTFYVFWVYMLK